MYDSVADLISVGTVSYDTYGNETFTQLKKTVYVQPRSVYRSEFYSAAQLDLHPSVTFVIANREDYSGEKIVEWNGKIYDVIRADWTAQRDAISLICQERIGKPRDPVPVPDPDPVPGPVPNPVPEDGDVDG